MLNKEQIELLFLGILKKCDTEQEKQLYRAIYKDVMNIYDEYKMHEKYFADKIQHYKYIKTQPLIKALNKNIEDLQKERGELIQELEKIKKERDKYRNKWGRVKNIIQKDGWQLDLIVKMENLLREIDMIFDDVEDKRNDLIEIRQEVNAVLEETK